MKTVIEMAREAGGMDGWGIGSKPSDPELSSDTFVLDTEDLGRFAALVRADEREVLLSLETDAHFIFNNPPGETSQDVRDVIEWYAASIRARGETHANRNL